jgi:hypothetical protein
MADKISGMLLKYLLAKSGECRTLIRGPYNPIITPRPEHGRESKATFNPSAILVDRKVHIVYRAMSADNTSTIGYATSSDGFSIDYRADEPVYVPREQFEMKCSPGANETGGHHSIEDRTIQTANLPGQIGLQVLPVKVDPIGPRRPHGAVR